MLYLIIIILIILIIFILFLIFSDITIHIMFRRTPDYQKSSAQVLFLNSLKLMDKKSDSKAEKREKIFDKFDKYSEIVTKSVGTIGRYNDFLKDINHNLGSGLKAAKLKLVTSIGAGDSALTAVLCGSVWAILGNLRMQKDYYNLFNNVEFSVNPNYKKKIFAIDVDSIFTIKTVYIIYVLISLKQIIDLEEEKIKVG